MSIYDLFWILILSLIIWAWWLDRGIKQKAYLYAKKYCDTSDVQLLDDNIYLSNLKLKRNHMNKWCIQRTFKMEFTSTGEYRYEGSMEVLGSKVMNIELAPFHI